MKKTAVITGSSRGIGAEIALKFAKIGYNVVVNYNKSRDKALKLLNDVKNFGAMGIAIQADVSEYVEAKRLIETAVNQFGHIDVLVNNAGISEQKLFCDISENAWENMFKININSMFNCTQHASRYMIKNHSGKIVNISSMWGISGASCEVHYSASKAAVIGFTKALAKELGPSGINVNCVAPGLIDTEMNSHLNKSDILNIIDNTPMCRIGTAADIAEAVAFLCSESSSFITGQVLTVDGGFCI